MCNNGASKDDEYLRTMIALSAKTHQDEAMEEVSRAAVRSLARSEAARFRNFLLGGLQDTFIRNERGVFVPATFGSIDLTRLDRVISRIIKGLFYTERGDRVPDDYDVVNYSTAGLTRIPKLTALPILAQVRAAMHTPMKLVGGPQFAFWSVYDPADLNQSFWIIAIYRAHSFLGWTVRRTEQRTPAALQAGPK
jgi:hypothetical protein